MLSALFAGIRQGAEACTDFLRVSEGRRVLSFDCGAITEPLVVTSRGPEVTVTLWGQDQTLYPHRGALIQYTGKRRTQLGGEHFKLLKVFCTRKTNNFMLERIELKAEHIFNIRFVASSTWLKKLVIWNALGRPAVINGPGHCDSMRPCLSPCDLTGP